MIFLPWLCLPVGSPVHAGIDPLLIIGGVAAFRFPRTRGDRPWLDITGELSIRVPPYTRG